MYRLLNYANVTTPDFDLSGFTAPTQDLAHTLGACIVGDQELQSKIVPILKARDCEIEVDRSFLLERSSPKRCGPPVTIPSRGFVCHRPYEEREYILVGRGEAQQVSPEIVDGSCAGWACGPPITGGRKGLKLPNEVRATVHTLAAAYGYGRSSKE